jgi:aminoglycoside phosphotransferase (APT) family kinase protein
MDDPPLDIEQHDQLIGYLRASRRIGGEETPRVKTLTGGVSNRTVLVERPTGESWVIKQALAKLRVKVDWFSDPARIHREALGLTWLQKLAPPGAITPLVFEDPQHHVLAMQAVPQPHENWKTMLLAGCVEPDHIIQFAHLLGQLHRDSALERGGDLPRIFDDRSFFESLRVEPYYLYTAEQVPQVKWFYRWLVKETRVRRTCLVHGDYSPKNILVRAGKLILLDHEVIHWGDGGFDVGFAMAHLLSKAHHVSIGAFAQAARLFWDEYSQALGYASDRSAAAHTLGCLLARVAGRSQLEYLSDEQKCRQRDVIVALMNEHNVGVKVPAVIGQFTSRIEHR